MEGTTFKVLSKKWRGATNEFQSKRKGLLVPCFFCNICRLVVSEILWERWLMLLVLWIKASMVKIVFLSMVEILFLSMSKIYLGKSLLVHSKGSICLEKTFESFKWGSLLDEVEGIIVISWIWLEVGVEPWYSDGRSGLFCCDVKINC